MPRRSRAQRGGEGRQPLASRRRLVVDDIVDASCVAALGGKQVARLMTGEVMGEMSFVDSAPPSATVQALETSMVLAIPRRRLNKRLTEDAGFAGRFYRALAMFLAGRLRTTTIGGMVTDRQDELAVEAMDNIGMAGARFDWIQKRLQGA